MTAPWTEGRCILVRTTKDGMRRRRYLVGPERVTTYELPAAALEAIGWDVIDRALKTAGPGQKRAARGYVPDSARAFIAEHADWKQEALASYTGISTTSVRRVLAALKGKNDR